MAGIKEALEIQAQIANFFFFCNMQYNSYGCHF